MYYKITISCRKIIKLRKICEDGIISGIKAYNPLYYDPKYVIPKTNNTGYFKLIVFIKVKQQLSVIDKNSFQTNISNMISTLSRRDSIIDNNSKEGIIFDFQEITKDKFSNKEDKIFGEILCDRFGI
jgi:hypothetical protein